MTKQDAYVELGKIAEALAREIGTLKVIDKIVAVRRELMEAMRSRD